MRHRGALKFARGLGQFGPSRPWKPTCPEAGADRRLDSNVFGAVGRRKNNRLVDLKSRPTIFERFALLFSSADRVYRLSMGKPKVSCFNGGLLLSMLFPVKLSYLFTCGFRESRRSVYFRRRVSLKTSYFVRCVI